MVLPSGVNKATGLAVALAELQLSPHNVVGVGDAENDHAFLKACGLSVAVANAIPAVKETAELVTKGARGEGVEELIGELIEHDQDFAGGRRNGIVVGHSKKNERPVELRPLDVVLIAGKSGLGKSSLAIALTERFLEKKFQFCVFDPEGDYEGLDGAVLLGNADTPPHETQVLELLGKPENNIVISTLALKVEERPGFFAKVMPKLSDLRARTARPHWLIIDETHHLLPASRDSQSLALTKDLPGSIMVTVHPEAVAKDILAATTVVLALGEDGNDIVKVFCKQAGIKRPERVPISDEDVLFWRPQSGKPPRPIITRKRQQAHKRHTRKYAEGELPEDASFYFRGPDGKLKLRAQNLTIFLQIAEGVDDRTWKHHLKAGDYSRWFRKQLKDKKLAKEVAAIEEAEKLPASESRKLISEAVRRRYTAPATAR
jgi:hypothetical protein